MPMYSDSPPLAVAAVLLGDRQAEGAHLGEALDDRPRGCRRCRGGCARRSASASSSAKRRNVSCTISKSSSRWRGPSVVDRGEERRVAVGGEERRGRRRARRARRPTRASRPNTLRGQVGDGVGDEGAGDAGPRRRPCRRSRAAPGRSRRRRRRGPGRRPAPGCRRSIRRRATLAWRGADDLGGEVDDGRGGAEVGGRRSWRRRLPTAFWTRLTSATSAGSAPARRRRVAHLGARRGRRASSRKPVARAAAG